MRAWVFSALLLVCCTPLLACRAPTGELSFETTRIGDIAISENDAPREFRFAFTNSGRGPIVITRVETSCGCTVADYDRRPIGPGEGGDIVVAYNPHGRAGTLVQTILVYTSGGEGGDGGGNAGRRTPPIRLELNGVVAPSADPWAARYPVLLGGRRPAHAVKAVSVTRPETGAEAKSAVGVLRAKRDTVSFAPVLATQVREERTECVNVGNTPVTLTLMAGMAPRWLSMRTEPEEIGPGEVADIVITIDGGRLHAENDEKNREPIALTLILEGLGGRPTERSLHLRERQN